MNNDLFLMCKDTPVYNISENTILDENLAPGSIVRQTASFDEWLRTRYSVGSNTSARRLMLRAFGADKHNDSTLRATRALSLSDCYWIKRQSEAVSFNDVSPYFNDEWDGNGTFKGGSISTLFVNGAADKRWINSQTLLKVGSFKEIEAYRLCDELGIKYDTKVELSDDGLLVTNFTSPNRFLESMEQSGFVQEGENAREKAVALFGEQAVALFVVDYLVEHDDRHWGNYGFMRNSDTGEYEGMSPYYDFDWVWSDGVVALPNNAIGEYSDFIGKLCIKAGDVAEKFEQRQHEVIVKRSSELLELITQT